MRSGRQEIERHGEDEVNHEDQDSNEPCGAAAVGHQSGGESGHHHHGNGAWPELQIHWRWPDTVAGEDQNRSNEECNLGGAAESDPNAEVKAILASAGKSGRHFRGSSDQGNYDEPHKGGVMPNDSAAFCL